MEVKKKFKNIKSYVLKSIERYGPIKARKLVQKVKMDYDLNVGHNLIFRIAKELLNENKVDAKKLGLANFYYQKGNISQELIALRLNKEVGLRWRKSFVKSKADHFITDILDNHDFEKEEIDVIKAIYPKLEYILNKVDVTGRSFDDVIKVAYLLFVKRQIYFIQKRNGNNFEAIKLWLRLHEILLDINLIRFHGFGFKTYQNLIKQILNEDKFCEQKDRNKILNSPDYKLKIRFLLTYFTEDIDLISNMLIFLDYVVQNGYSVEGKDIRGVTGGLIYIFGKISRLNLTQKAISKSLNITGVTLRKRKNELLECYSTSLQKERLRNKK